MEVHAVWCYARNFADTDGIKYSYRIIFNNLSNNLDHKNGTKDATDYADFDAADEFQKISANEDENQDEDKDKDEDKEGLLQPTLWAQELQHNT